MLTYIFIRIIGSNKFFYKGFLLLDYNCFDLMKLLFS